MTYYRCMKDFNNVNAISKSGDCFPLVKSELFTEKEFSKLCEQYYIPTKHFEKVNISKRNIYFFFGARFECGC